MKALTGIVLLLFFAACVRPASSSLQADPIPSLVPGSGIPLSNPTATLPAPTASGGAVPSNTAVLLTATEVPEERFAPETVVIPLALQGEVSQAGAQISGMAWYGDSLILLPQYPHRLRQGGTGIAFALQKSEIIDYLDAASPPPLQPIEIEVIAPGIQDRVRGFEGFESIAIAGEHVYLTIEANPGSMLGYLISGTIAQNPLRIQLDTTNLVSIPPQSNQTNSSDEALLIFGEMLFSIYELNGRQLNPHPLVHMYDLSLQAIDTLSFPSIEYRITDVTPADEYGRFWAINYFFPGDSAQAVSIDPLAAQFGEGQSHSVSDTVERLVEFQFSEAGIVFADHPPIQLALQDRQTSRNWEAIARLDEMGFLLATDRHPATILAFVPYP